MSGHQAYSLIKFLLIVCFSQVSYGQIPNSNHTDGLKQDSVFFRNNIQNKYPSPNRYSATKLNTVFDSCYSTINKETTDLEFYKKIKVLMSKMKDGHLYGSLPAQLETYRNEKALFFPVKLQFIAHKVYADTVPNPLIPAGSEIISINNKPILAIQIELLKYLVSDGNIQTKKYRILNNFFYFYYFIAFAEQPYFDVVYKSRDGQIKKDRIKADLEKNIIANEKPDSPQPPIDFSIKPGHIALITIRTFDPQALKVDFKEFLTTSFKQVLDLNIKTIIIDLRGNGGGKDTYGSLLYTYLANKPFKYYKNLKTVTKNLEYEKFKTNVSSYNDLKPSMIKEVGGHQYQMDKEAHPNLQLIPPNKYHYDGKVLFLIDGSSFSTASEFCAIAYSHKRGDFIGEETGGTYDGNTSGVQTEFILPNTKMEISFGPVKYEMSVNPVKEIGRGVIPQHKIYPNIQDIIENKDVQLKYAIWLAGQ